MKRMLTVCVSLSLVTIAAGVVVAQNRHLSDLARPADPSGATATATPASGSSAAADPAETARLATGPAEAAAAAALAPVDAASRDFETLAEQVLSALPKRPELRGSREERARAASPVVVRPGSLLGRVSQALHAHPDLASRGSQFYRRCTVDADFVTSVRALCYARLIAREPLASVDVPANVRSLAHQIMN